MRDAKFAQRLSSATGQSPVRWRGWFGLISKKKITNHNSAQQNLHWKNPAVLKQNVASHPGRFMPGDFPVSAQTFRPINPFLDALQNFPWVPINRRSVGSSVELQAELRDRSEYRCNGFPNQLC